MGFQGFSAGSGIFVLLLQWGVCIGEAGEGCVGLVRSLGIEIGTVCLRCTVGLTWIVFIDVMVL